MRTLFLVDGSSYFYRAFFGLRGLATSKGFPTNAIHVFATMLTRIARQHPADFLAVVWDAPGRTFRDDLYEAYKATRAPMPEDLSKQIPLIKRLPGLFAIRSVEVPGVEADDAIGTLAREALEKGIDVVILTAGVQLVHLLRLAREMGVEAEVREGLDRTVIASIGPMTSEELQRHGLPVDLESSHSKMGFLVKEAAEQCEGLLRAKRCTEPVK